MPRNPMSRAVLIRLGMIAATVSMAGCPSGGGSGDIDSPPVGVIEHEPPAEAAVELTSPNGEPGLLPEAGHAEPIVAPLPAKQLASDADEPIQQTAGRPGMLPNPLRDGNEPPLRDREAPRPEPRPSQPAAKKSSDEPFDPIKVNGPIFVGWPKPKLAVVITGRQDGYLEPCGCAGLDRMKGGMSRRYSFFNHLRNERGWAVAAVDVGGLAKGYGRQAELKFQTTVEGMRKMGYGAITPGKAELRLPTGELLSVDCPESPLVSANVGLFGPPGEYTAQIRIIDAGGMKLGVTGILGRQFQQAIHSDTIEMTDPEAALAKVLPDLKQKADYLILLAHATREESVELARKFPDFDLVVTAGGAAEPPAKPARIKGTEALLIEVGEKGMDAIVLGVFDDPKRPLRYQRVPLDSRFPASNEMQKLMELYQDQIKELGFEGLGLRAVPHPQKELGGSFVGSRKCETCHEESYIVWKKSEHSKAYATLSGLDPPRQFDPECVSCHVTGWHPTEHYPYETGYQSLEKTPHLIDVGCETCHGPGGAHVAAENGSDLALQEKLRKPLVVTKAEAADPRSGKHHCFTCHDLDNSPDFDLDTYWPSVEHYEDDE